MAKRELVAIAGGGESKPAARSFSIVDDIDELRRRLERAVARVCPAWLESQREDIVQEAMVRVLKIVERSEEDRPLNASYLWRVGYTATIDQIRRVRAKREVSLVDAAELPDSRAAGNPERAAAAGQIKDEIAGCLASLSEDRRRFVMLHLLGHTVPEVAALLGAKTKRAENLVYRALADLRACLRKKGMR